MKKTTIKYEFESLEERGKFLTYLEKKGYISNKIFFGIVIANQGSGNFDIEHVNAYIYEEQMLTLNVPSPEKGLERIIDEYIEKENKAKEK